MDKNPPRQLILGAVLTCIEKYGIDKITTRKIAEEAGTNIASINYYFRTKEALVAEALSMALNHMLEDVNAAIADQGKSFLDILEEVLFYLIDGNNRFPGITTAHLYSAVFEKQSGSPGANAINTVFETLADRAIKEYPRKKPAEQRFILSQILAATMFMMLSPNFFPSVEPLQITDAKTGRALAKSYRQMYASVLNI
jgi:TetR/AcrR family transcriptional regulator, regulator of cefoperazone and chloramphenicol sensitivity